MDAKRRRGLGAMEAVLGMCELRGSTGTPATKITPHYGLDSRPQTEWGPEQPRAEESACLVPPLNIMQQQARSSCLFTKEVRDLTFFRHLPPSIDMPIPEPLHNENSPLSTKSNLDNRPFFSFCRPTNERP